MTRLIRLVGSAIAALTLLAACNEQIVVPEPVKMTRAAVGHYCSMIAIDHPGPKAQVHERDLQHPLWFSSVRDAIAYVLLPGEAQNVLVMYVHDMGAVASWEHPPAEGAWIRASDAVYVIGSDRRGGMGANETVPFADRQKAEIFVTDHGGRIVAFDEIPPDYVIGDSGEQAHVPPKKDETDG